MAEPQLIDYIKKAKQSGQPDDQSRALLYKNGWTEAEVNDAFSAVNPVRSEASNGVNQLQAAQPQAQPQPQSYYQPEPASRPKRSVLRIILGLFIVLIVLIIIGIAGYFIARQFINLSSPAPELKPVPALSPESVILKAWDNSQDIKNGISLQDEALFKRIAGILIDKKAYNITQLPNGYSVLLDQQKVTDVLPDIFDAIEQEYPGAYTLETFQNKINGLFAAGPISADLFFDRTGKKIDKIDTALNLEELIRPFVKIQKIRTDMSQIGAAAQSIFNADNSYAQICKNNLLNGGKETYGKQFTIAVNDIIKQGAGNPICFGDSENYCVSSRQAGGTWMCIGKNGILGRIKCDSSNTVCSTEENQE